MSSEQTKFVRPLLPAQPLPEIHDQHDDQHPSSIMPLTPATTPFHRLDSNLLPTWPDPGHSIWRNNRSDAASPQHECWVKHEIIQVYHCFPVLHHHTWMPPSGHAVPSSQEAGYPLESASFRCVPPLRLCLMGRIDSEPMSSIVERMPGADSSIMQTINPVLGVADALKTTPETFSRTASPVAAAEVCPVTPDTGTSSTRSLDPPQENSEIVHDTTMFMNDPSLLDCHVLREQPGLGLGVEDQELDMHKRKFNCTIIDCRRSFKRRCHLERHIRSHSKEKPHVCWVPGCHRAFSRRDNLKAHCTKTHTTHGGRNRYVATLDETSPDYDPGFRGQLSFDGRPVRILASSNPLPEAKPEQR
ncbi:hypothetical protein N7475_003584 [Penicillium sp. IBT 31633x]|nr:hypothetical protein N7475_003584 [Penicillium sp. IBT 31633x]